MSGVRREDTLHEATTAGREVEQDYAAVGVAGTPPHQPPIDELVHDVGGAAALDEDLPLHLAHRQLALVVQHLQHSELGGAEAKAGDARPGVPLDRIERASEHDPQVQRRVVHALGTSSGADVFRNR